MSRLVARTCLLFAAVACAVVGAASNAGAQQLPYPGPFGTGGDFTENEVPTTQPGVDNDGDGYADVSIDANPTGNGISFVQVDAQPGSGDAGDDAVGGTGGGDAGAGLALTGVESELTMAVAMGLLAAGGASVVGSRRRLRSL